MKRYVPIIIGIVALCAVLYVGTTEMSKDDKMSSKSDAVTAMTTFNGEVTRQFEGSSTLMYSFDIPETATTTVEKDGALIKVKDNDTSLVEVYLSYEGGRGYSPEDYITNVIVPNVPAVTDNGTTTIGTADWNVVESERSVWHVGKVADGNWLVVVENRKVDNDKVQVVLESFTTK